MSNFNIFFQSMEIRMLTIFFIGGCDFYKKVNKRDDTFTISGISKVIFQYFQIFINIITKVVSYAVT